MKIIVTHHSPDLDAITSVWLLRKFLPGWQEAQVEFVHPGEKSQRVKKVEDFDKKVVVDLGEDEIIHVDTGLGLLDHHQTADNTQCAASLTWDYIRQEIENAGNHFAEGHTEALTRLVKFVVDHDHFKEVTYPDAAADRYDFSLVGILDGLKLSKQNDNQYYVDFVIPCLDALFHTFENKLWVENEVKEKGIEFETKYGKGIGVETLNHALVKLGQRMGYIFVVRKDPRNGFAAIAVHPLSDINLTLAYEQLSKMDPDATWYLHISKKMLLNGSQKNPNMTPTTLSLEQIVRVLENLYK